MQQTDTSRRELNRLQTWEAVHQAAIELVLSVGLAGATIDSIAERAAVSRRTFFNYFEAKEDAVLGTRAPALTPEDLAAFESSTEDAFGRVARLMTAAVRSAFHDLPSFTKRHAHLLKQYPELRARVEQHVRGAESLVREVLAATAPADEETRVLLMTAGTVMRYAFTPNPDGSINDAPDDVEAAIARFRSVLAQIL